MGDGDTLERFPLDWKILLKPFLENGDLCPEDNRSTQVFCPYLLGLGPQGLPGEVLRSRAMRRPRVATLAARSSLPCCCTRAGSDVIRVFMRDVKQASRLGRKGRKDGGGGLTELGQGLGTSGILSSQFHQAGFGKK